MKIIRLLSLFLFVCGYAMSAYATDVDDTFFRANNAYQQENYETAIDLYEMIIDQGVVSGAVYYNVGNAYFRTGKIGKAIVQYERAKKIMPQDEDLFANSSLAYSRMKEVQPTEKVPWFIKVFQSVRDMFSAKVWFVFAASVYGLLFLVIVLTTIIPALRQHRAMLVCLMTIF